MSNETMFDDASAHATDTIVRNMVSKIAMPSVVLVSSLHEPLMFLVVLRTALVRSASTGIVPMVNVGLPSMYFSAMSLMEQSQNFATGYFRIHARSIFKGRNTLVALSWLRCAVKCVSIVGMLQWKCMETYLYCHLK